MIASCEDCIFWHKEMSGGTICRRYPPAAEAVMVRFNADETAVERYTTLSFFPPMQAGGWCGEHSAAAAKRSAA